MLSRNFFNEIFVCMGHGNGYIGQVGPKKRKKSKDIKLLLVFVLFLMHGSMHGWKPFFHHTPGRSGLLLLWRLWGLSRWSCIGGLPVLQLVQLLESIGVNLGGLVCLKGQGQLISIDVYICTHNLLTQRIWKKPGFSHLPVDLFLGLWNLTLSWFLHYDEVFLHPIILILPAHGAFWKNCHWENVCLLNQVVWEYR